MCGGQVTDYFEDGEVRPNLLKLLRSIQRNVVKRRLTHESFFSWIRKSITTIWELHFKTDNRGLFEYSLASFSQFGLVLKQVWLDLHQVEFPGNDDRIRREILSKGHPIYRVEVDFPTR